MATGRVNVRSSSNEPNIFIQSTEPNSKEGIWFKTPFKELENISIGNFGQIIMETNGAYTDPYGEMAYGLYKNLFILFGGKNSPQCYYLYKYDINTRLWTKLTNSVQIENQNTSVVGFNDVLYFIGSYRHARTVSRYDLSSDTWLSEINAPSAMFNSAVIEINGKIYQVGGTENGSNYYGAHFVLDPSNNTWKTLATCPIARPGSSVRVMSYKNGYYLQYDKTLYYYNIDSNTWTLEATLDISSGPLGNFGVIVRDSMFLRVGSNIYEYNILTKTGRMTDLLAGQSAKSNLIYKDKVLMPQFTASPSAVVLNYTDVNYVRSNNYVLLCENQNTGFETCLFNVNNRKLNNRVTQQITDALLFIDDVKQVVPTYYGDGTQWIKFKN